MRQMDPRIRAQTDIRTAQDPDRNENNRDMKGREMFHDIDMSSAKISY